MERKGYGYYKVAAVTFPVAIGNTEENAENIIRYIEKALQEKVQLLVFPELSVTGYTCGDMFLRGELQRQAEKSLDKIRQATEKNNLLVCVGMPVNVQGRLFNCAVYLQNGEIKGAVPKTYVPNYGEFYEKRWFVSADLKTCEKIPILGREVPFSENLLLKGQNDVVIGTEICEDLWVSNPPSGLLSRAGATIIVNPSASNDVIGKRSYRYDLVKMQSGRCRAGYVYASCGAGESSTDLVFSGHCMIAENGRVLKEVADILTDEAMITDVIDIERCVNDRCRYNSDLWGKCPDVIEVDITVEDREDLLPAAVDPYPFVPGDGGELKKRCEEILKLQERGLMQRLRAIKCSDVVLGLSGGLDSTLALVVCCEAFDRLSMDRKHIHCFSMPGFGTTEKTHSISEDLAKHFGVSFKEVNIREACLQHMRDIGHAEDVYDIAYENIQARERTQILFDYANMVNGIVIGTGDMSESALGWCTYNGDHMSNYAVNVGVPKTLVKWLIRYYADEYRIEVLKRVLDLPISPELLPAGKDGEIVQKTEESIGKYDLHDFFLYHFLRNGFGREKIKKLAQIAYPQVTEEEIEKTLTVFYSRMRTQQFKRSCIPDGVKIGSVALSPRGDLRLPSDLSALW